MLFVVLGCNRDNDENNLPDANFSITGYESPAPATITFVNISTNATGYLWNFGDGATSTDQYPTHVYTLPGTYLLKLKVTGPGGADSMCKLISIDPPVVPNKSSFNYFFDKCSGYPVGAAFKSLNPASSNTVWDFGNGVVNISRDPIVQFLLPGDYTIKYSSQINNVRDTVVRVIRIE
jgi:PKD repeat protein